eukprot:143662_1
MVAVLRVLWELAGLHVGVVGLQGRGHRLGDVAVLLHELWGEGLKLAHHVGQDQKLPVAFMPSPDPVNGDVELLGDEAPDLRRNRLQQQELGSGVCNGKRVFDDRLGRLDRAALGQVAPELARGLGGHAGVSKHEDARIDDRSDLVLDANAALELDGV